jgi:hypothetical protein
LSPEEPRKAEGALGLGAEDDNFVPLEVKNRYESKPLLIYPPGHDYITVWRKADLSEFFVAGKYLHPVLAGGKVTALAYRKLTKEEVELVEQHIRVTMKIQNPIIKYYRE